MITRISSPVAFTKTIQAKSTPSFGFAKLNETGRETADTFGYESHKFLNENLFKRQTLFSKSALTTVLKDGASFTEICNDYGCSKNGKSNAEFIKTQILSGKSNPVLSKLDDEERFEGLKSLFFANYDNPELSKRDTDALLDMIQESLEATEFVKLAGLIKVGADK